MQAGASSQRMPASRSRKDFQNRPKCRRGHLDLDLGVLQLARSVDLCRDAVVGVADRALSASIEAQVAFGLGVLLPVVVARIGVHRRLVIFAVEGGEVVVAAGRKNAHDLEFQVEAREGRDARQLELAADRVSECRVPVLPMMALRFLRWSRPMMMPLRVCLQRSTTGLRMSLVLASRAASPGPSIIVSSLSGSQARPNIVLRKLRFSWSSVPTKNCQVIESVGTDVLGMILPGRAVGAARRHSA